MSIEFPKSKLALFVLQASLGLGLIMMLHILDYLLRDDTSFEFSDRRCGTIIDYYHDRDKKRIGTGFATWRLVVNNQGNKEIYKVGANYIQNNIVSEAFNVGSKICIEISHTLLGFDTPFISQLEISGVTFLNSEEVEKAYFRPLAPFFYWVFGFSCAFAFFSLIRFKKEL